MNPVQVYKRLQKNRNRRRSEMEIRRGAVHLKSVPFEIYFNPENRCQLRCTMCRNTVERHRGTPVGPWGKGPVPALRRLQKLRGALPYWNHVRLTGSGETLLCPDLLPLIQASKKQGIHVSFATNGQLIDRAMARRLVLSGLDDLVVSVDAATADTYEKIRVGARWVDLLRALEALRQVKEELGSSKPRLILSGNFARYNIEELPRFIDFAIEREAAEVYIFKTIFFEGEFKCSDLSHYPDLTSAAYVESRRRAEGAGLQYSNWLVRPFEAGVFPEEEADRPHQGKRSRDHGRLDPRAVLKRCNLPWTGLLVNYDGTVRFCCANSNILGNLDEQPFDQIWNGEPAKAIRRLFLEGRLPEGCRHCPEITGSNDLSTTDASRDVTERDGCIEFPNEGQTVSGVAELNGWIVDPAPLSSVIVCIDGQWHTVATAPLERADVVRVHPRCRQGQWPGFSCSLDSRDLPNGYHLFHVEARSQNGEIRNMFHRVFRVKN